MLSLVPGPARARCQALLLCLLGGCAAAEPISAPAAAISPPASTEPARSAPPVASYSLRARLDAELHEIQGEGEIHWLNAAARATDELYLHLYLNAFAGPRTLLQRSPLRRARGARPPQRWGQIALERLSVRELGGADLLPALAAHSPGDPDDGTDLRVALPRAVAPGERLTLAVKWRSVLPELQIRTGYAGDFHFVGQWFPKLARLEPDGTWAHFAFDPLAEFYADFGSYDVTLDVPEQMVVGATGHLVSESRAGGRRSLRYQVESVHDFAWTAWPRFREQHERIDGVDVHLLYPPGHAHNARCTLDVLRQALPHFSARYGRYPYADLTVVHPPSAAANAGGMEYPTLITTGGAWHESHWSRAVEYVTAHELGHQWFYGLLASNERRWPFLDEGLNSYAEGVAVREFYGPASASSALGFPLSSEALRRFVMLSRPHDVPIAAAATEFPSLRDLGAVVYQRSALLLQTLANVYGEGALSAALSRYALRFRFQHPTPDDLLAVLGETLAPDALENLRAALFKGHTVDYELSSLESARLGPDPNNPSRELFESRALVSRHGELAFPVQVLLITEAGERITHTWDGRERFRSFTHRGPSRVAHALVDPELRVLIDENLLDNSRALHPALPLGPYATSVQLLYLLAGLVAP